MLGERSDQRGLWEADRLYLDHVGRESFYGLLASMRGRLFRDADFAKFYCPDNGRDSVPPSLLATALLLQSHDKVSDAEAKARADFDLRWKVALGIEAEDRPFAKSTLQVFSRPADPARQGAGGIRVQSAAGPGVGLSEKGVGCGWRWTRPTSWGGARSRTPTSIGRRDRQIVAGAGGGGASSGQGMGPGPGDMRDTWAPA